MLYHGHTLVGCGDTAENRRIEFCYEGPAMNIHSEFDVRVDGDVEGSIKREAPLLVTPWAAMSGPAAMSPVTM